MTASFPTSIKSFTTKVEGVTSIECDHVNDLQDEIHAIEDGLRSDSASWISPVYAYTWTDYNNVAGNGSCERPLVDTVNYCKNPSFEVNVTDDVTKYDPGAGATITQDTTYYKVGTKGLRLTAGNVAGCEWWTNAGVSVPNGQTVTASGWVRCSANPEGSGSWCGVRFSDWSAWTIVLHTAAGNQQWEYITATLTNTSGVTKTAVISGKNNYADSATYFTYDACQLELATAPSEYCDGSLGTGYAWDGTAHNSVSRLTGCDWSKNGGYFARVTSPVYIGTYSGALQGVAGTSVYCYTISTVPVANGETVTVTAKLRGNADPSGNKVIFLLKENGGGYATYGTQYLTTTDTWEDMSLVWTNTTGSSKNVHVLVVNGYQSTSNYVYIDNLYFTTSAYVQPVGGYWKDVHGTVHLRGDLARGDTAYWTPMFILPTGYRPASNQIFLVVVSGGATVARVTVYNDGQVLVGISASSSFISLHNISFQAA
jgi:hypothetical protein